MRGNGSSCSIVLTLYTYWRSTAAYRVRIALGLKGISYRALPVNLLQEEQTEKSYLKINPQGLVPALGVGAAYLTQSLAILEYLEEAYPDPNLLPASLIERAGVRSFCQTIACDIHPVNNLRVLQHLRSRFGCEENEVAEWYRRWVAGGFVAMESQVQRNAGLYCFGAAITMADVCLVPQMYNARRFDCDLAPYPRLVEVAQRLELHPAFAEASPERQSDMPLPR